jgi:hypothetical protein
VLIERRDELLKHHRERLAIGAVRAVGPAIKPRVHLVEQDVQTLLFRQSTQAWSTPDLRCIDTARRGALPPPDGPDLRRRPAVDRASMPRESSALRNLLRNQGMGANEQDPSGGGAGLV